MLQQESIPTRSLCERLRAAVRHLFHVAILLAEENRGNQELPRSYCQPRDRLVTVLEPLKRLSQGPKEGERTPCSLALRKLEGALLRGGLPFNALWF